MVISHKHKFIFIKTTKVGGTSLELFLDKVCSKEDVFTPYWNKEKDLNFRNNRALFNPFPEILERKKYEGFKLKKMLHNTLSDFKTRNKFFENIPAWQLKNRIPKNIWDDYLIFTIERNPWDKCVSRYYHSKGIFEPKYKKELTFKMWFDYFVNRIENPWVTTAWGSEAPYNYPRYANPWTNELLVNKICRYEQLEDDLSEVFNTLNVPFNGLSEYNAKGNYRKDKRHYSAFFVIEFSARIGGGSKHHLIKRISDFNILNFFIDVLENKIDYNLNVNNNVKTASIKYIYTNSGTIKKIISPEKEKEDGMIDDFFFYKTQGMKITGNIYSSDRICGIMLIDFSNPDLCNLDISIIE